MEKIKLSKTCGVYRIRNLVDGKIYIGSTSSSFTKRWDQWRRDLRERKINSHLVNAWHKHGPENFEFTVVEVVDLSGMQPAVAKVTLLLREQHYIDTLKPEYNVLPVAGSPLGTKLSEETRAKMSEDRKGREVSEETRRKIGEAHLGNTHNLGKKRGAYSEQHRAKISQSLAGRKKGPPSEETRRKISEANTGKDRSNQRINPNSLTALATSNQARATTVTFKDPQGNLYEVTGVKAFCKQKGLHQGAMSMVAAGKSPHHKGWTKA